MADPHSAVATQLRNIETRTGKSFAQLCRLIADSGLTKVGEQRTMLMDKLHLGYGDANMLALRAKDAAMPAAADANPLDAIYAGAKAPLRKLHDRLLSEVRKLGAFETAPKKAYVSLRRKKQFVELGLNAKGLPASARLKALPPGGMCQYAVRLSAASEIDAELLAWVRTAYDAAA
jgi:hypothetical protein